MRRTALALMGALVVALAAAALLDALGVGWLRRDHSVPVVSAALLGGMQALAWGALRGGERHLRHALVGATVGGATGFLLVRAPVAWVDLGAIAAGPPGELPLVVLPLASILAVVSILTPLDRS